MIPNGLDDNIIYQTGSFTKSFLEQMERAFGQAGFNITAEQFNLLTLLWYEDGLSQQQLADAVGRDKTTVSRVLDRMVKRDLVKKVSGQDKRERLIYLTRHGKVIQLQLVNISGNLYMKIIRGIPVKELLQAIKILQTMNKNLE
jgi:DNA-binding MarR family transcriptional regulator